MYACFSMVLKKFFIRKNLNRNLSNIIVMKINVNSMINNYKYFHNKFILDNTCQCPFIRSD